VVSSGTGRAVNVPTIPPLLVEWATEVFGGKSHAWFGAYAPHKPEIVVVAFAEHAGGGGGSCCSMVLKVGAYFHR